MYYPNKLTPVELYSYILSTDMRFDVKSKLVDVLMTLPMKDLNVQTFTYSIVPDWMLIEHRCPTCGVAQTHWIDIDFLNRNGECLGCDDRRGTSPDFVLENENNEDCR